MLLTIAHIALVVLLVLTFVQDMKHRAIHFVLPLLTFVVALYVYFEEGHPYQQLLTTFLFLAITMLGLFAYMSIKRRTLVNPINSDIGIGDIVFFIAVIPLFYVRAYILFFITGMLFSILCHLALKHVIKNKYIPLAGYLSLYILLLMVADQFTASSLFKNPIIGLG